MVQTPSPMVWTQKPQAEQPTNLHAGKTQQEGMVTSQALCIAFKKRILLWNNSFSTIKFLALSPKFCQWGLLLNTTPSRVIATE